MKRLPWCPPFMIGTIVLLGAACGDDAPCDPAAGACQIGHDYGAVTLPAGTEIAEECYTWTLNNPTDLWVSAVEMENDGAVHHSNWFYVPDNKYDTPDGMWDCEQLHFGEISAALAGGVLYAQSTQARAEVQQFPQGAVVRVPASSRIIGGVHLLNASAGPVTTGLRMTLHTVPEAEVKIKLTPMRLSYLDLHIPPKEVSEFTSTCDMKTTYEQREKSPFAVSLYYVLPHYHVLGDLFRLRIAGGPRDGDLLYELRGGFGDANGRAFDPPVDLSTATGLTFTCGYDNPRAQEVGWGIGDQEMCVMLGFITSPLAYDASVLEGMATGPQDGTAMNSGPCSVEAFDFYPG